MKKSELKQMIREELQKLDERKLAGKELIDAIRNVYDQKQAQKINGSMVDLFTASAIIKVYDSISEKNKANLASMTLPKIVNITWKLINKVS